MGNILNALINSTINSVNAKLDEISTKIVETDFDAEFASIKKRMNSEIKRLTKNIHNCMDKWTVEVDYNLDEEIITSQIRDNTLIVEVKNDENTINRQFSTTIPEDVLVDSCKQTYNPTTHKAIYSFKKKMV